MVSKYLFLNLLKAPLTTMCVHRSVFFLIQQIDTYASFLHLVYANAVIQRQP